MIIQFFCHMENEQELENQLKDIQLAETYVLRFALNLDFSTDRAQSCCSMPSHRESSISHGSQHKGGHTQMG